MAPEPAEEAAPPLSTLLGQPRTYTDGALFFEEQVRRRVTSETFAGLSVEGYGSAPNDWRRLSDSGGIGAGASRSAPYPIPLPAAPPAEGAAAATSATADNLKILSTSANTVGSLPSTASGDGRRPSSDEPRRSRDVRPSADAGARRGRDAARSRDVTSPSSGVASSSDDDGAGARGATPPDFDDVSPLGYDASRRIPSEAQLFDLDL